MSLQFWLIIEVKQGLIDLNWSQAHLARQAGISAKHLSLILGGKAAASVETWDRLLALVGRRP